MLRVTLRWRRSYRRAVLGSAWPARFCTSSSGTPRLGRSVNDLAALCERDACFRFGGRRFKRSLKTKHHRIANSKKVRLEDTVALVESGRIPCSEFLSSRMIVDRSAKSVSTMTLGESDEFHREKGVVMMARIENTGNSNCR